MRDIPSASTAPIDSSLTGRPLRHTSPVIAIGCGGTGGHLFPGLAVAEALQERGCRILLLVSRKEIDQQAVRNASVEEVISLPAVGLEREKLRPFLSALWESFRICQRAFARLNPSAVLAMGGFTSAAPVLAAKQRRAATFLHESNAIPGRANRCLAFFVRQAFVGFPSAARGLAHDHIITTGTPVRSEIAGQDPAACRIALGLDPARPALLVMGGSQGAAAINQWLLGSLPALAHELNANWQFLHLTGTTGFESTRAAYLRSGLKAIVRPFLTEMELALGAATLAVSRAGASALAELAAARIPALLIPYPQAADNHQFYNARAFAQSGAAVLLDQATASPQHLIDFVKTYSPPGTPRDSMQRALTQWHRPAAAGDIAGRILAALPSAALDRASPMAAAQPCFPASLRKQPSL